MAIRPIKLRLDGEEIHLVSKRELDRWGGYINAPRAAYSLVTPENVATVRRSLLTPAWTDTEGVFTELRKQLEDGSALFFEIPPQPATFDSPKATNIFDLIPDGHLDDGKNAPGRDTGIHWIEVIYVSAKGESFAGASVQARLPGGRTEHTTLDGNSSVRFDDLTEGGTAHFELSADAIARGRLRSPEGTRYELGASLGLSTRRQHILVVHPNPAAFVTAALFVDAEPVTVGNYTLTTKLGDSSGALDGDAARAEGFVLPSAASYSFEQVVLPPRPAEDDSQGPHDDPFRQDDAKGPVPPGPMGGDPITHEPENGPVPKDVVRVTLRLEDGSPIPGKIRLVHANAEHAEGDQAEFRGIQGAGTLTAGALQLPPESNAEGP